MAKRLAELTIDVMEAKVEEVKRLAQRFGAIRQSTKEAGIEPFICDGHGRYAFAVENLHLFAESAELYLSRAIRHKE